MYEDNLYLSNLYEYLEHGSPGIPGPRHAPAPIPATACASRTSPSPIPGTNEPALRHIDLHIRPGQSLALVGQNGSGKTTLIKLLARLYEPTEGRILLDGLDLREWDEKALRRRIGVIFQDFVRYQMLAGENIGAGDVERFSDEAGWRDAAQQGMAAEFLESLPESYSTQLGRWFRGGRELSGGQWQKVAVAGPSCAATRTSWSWTNPPPPWTPRPRRRCSSTSAASPATRSPS